MVRVYYRAGNAGLDEFIYRVIEHSPPANDLERLGLNMGQRAHARPEPGSQNHGGLRKRVQSRGSPLFGLIEMSNTFQKCAIVSSIPPLEVDKGRSAPSEHGA